MNRHTHLWFFVGFLIAGGTIAAGFVVVALASELGRDGMIGVFAALELLVIGAAVWHVKSWAKHKAQMQLRISSELSCAEARRLRLRQRLRRVPV